MFKFDLQLFGGGKKSKVSSTQAVLPNATNEEKQLLQNQLGWINQTNNSANRLQGLGDNALNQTVTPQYQQMYNQYLDTNNANQNAIGALQNRVSSAGTSNLTDNTKYANQLAASVNDMNNTSTQLANEYNGALLQNQNAMNSLVNGELPSAYANARRTALNSDLENTVGSTLGGLANRGIINSSQADTAFNNISKNASNTLANQYSQDLGQASALNTQALNNNLNGIGAKMSLWGNTYNNQQNGIMNQANLMNQGYTNQINNAGTLAGLVGQAEGLAQNPINTGSTTQSAAIQPAKDYYTMAQLNNADNEDLLNRFMQYRYSLAAPAQTTVKQGSGGFFGGLLGGFCFRAGTMIATLEYSKAIETFEGGEKLVSLGEVIEVIAMHDMGDKPTHKIKTDDCYVVTTGSEKVLTPSGLKLVEDLELGEKIMTVHGYQTVQECEPTGETEHVYELECTGSNLFYAEGILAEGITQEELQALQGQQEQPKKRGRKKKVEE